MDSAEHDPKWGNVEDSGEYEFFLGAKLAGTDDTMDSKWLLTMTRERMEALVREIRQILNRHVS